MKILLVIVFVAAFFVALIAWYRIAKNMFVLSKHVTPEGLLKYSSVRINHLNAIFYQDALDTEGKQAKHQIVLNTGVFVGSVVVSFLMGYISGLTT